MRSNWPALFWSRSHWNQGNLVLLCNFPCVSKMRKHHFFWSYSSWRSFPIEVKLRPVYCTRINYLVEQNLLTSDSTDSQETIQFIRTKLRTCDENHQICITLRRMTDWYPTRLIDLGAAEGDRVAAKLIITSKSPPKGPYVSFSHCVGLLKLSLNLYPN
jgi:hypothetical protein